MKITIAQIDIADHQAEENSTKIINIIKANAQSDIILFPELALTGFPTSNEIQSAHSNAECAFHAVRQASSECQTKVLIGHIEKVNGNFYNSAFLLAHGQEHVIHRKAHLWLDDQGVFQCGDHSTLFAINQHQVGSQICFDLEFPEGSRALATAGAELILMPNGNMHPYENTHFILSQARAIENQVFVVTCNRVGQGHGGHFSGESLVVSPFGSLLLKMDSKEAIQTIELDMADVQRSRTDYQYITHQ